MRQLVRFFILLGVIVPASACMHSRPGDPVDRATLRRTDLITRDEIDKQHWANAYELVIALRPNWLHPRGPDTVVGTPVQLQVHINGVRAGTISVLNETDVTNLVYVEYIDPIAATARWGLGYGHGAIDLSTKPK
jgi:hypothetical protein